jgi:hypothetical protein
LNGFDVRRRFDDLDLHNERRRSEVCFLAFGKAPLPAAYDEEAVMDVIHKRVAGLHVHKETVVARAGDVREQGDAGIGLLRRPKVSWPCSRG